jgi:maltose-binding protein MalE
MTSGSILGAVPPIVKKIILLLAFWLVAGPAFAWTDGELLVWMDADRTRTLELILKKFEDQYAIKVRLEAPQNITDNFLTAAQCGKGPDIVIWAHDKVGEWADAGIISPLEVSNAIRQKYFPQAWEAVTHKDRIGKVAMMISGPWAWANLMRTGIDFGVAPVPGCDGKPARPFVGVSAAYINRASSNQDISKEFVENFLISEEGLKAMNDAKPIGIPSLITFAEQLDQANPLLMQMKSCIERGEVMPNIPEMSRFWPAVGGALQLATNGQAPAQAPLQEAAENMRSTDSERILSS